MTHPMMMNCPHSDDSVCLGCTHEYYTTHVIPLENACAKMRTAKDFEGLVEYVDHMAIPEGEAGYDDLVKAKRALELMACSDSCMAMIKEAIEQLGEPMDATPPMMYPEAISNLCAKRNRIIAELKEALQYFCDQISEDPLGVGVEHTNLLHAKHKAQKILHMNGREA